MPQEKELTTVKPEVREKINQLSAEVQGVSRETTEEKKNPESKPEAQETVQETQQAQAEVQNEIDELTEEAEKTADPKRKNRANERIQELVAQKKQLEELLNNYSRYTPLIEEYERIQQEQSKPKYTEFNSQEEFYNAVKEQAKREAIEEIRKEIQPVVVDNANARYQKEINTWFEKNPGAKDMKEQMEQLSSQLSEEEKVFYQKQILSGNHRPLDFIFRAIKPEANTSGAIKKAIQQDQVKAGTASSKRSSKAVDNDDSSFDSDLQSAFKRRDFKKLINKHLLNT